MADVFAMLKLPFDSEEAKEINEAIFEMIYFSAVETSLSLQNEQDQLNEIKTYKLKMSNGEELTEEEQKNYEKLTKKYRFTDEEINRDKYIGSYSTFEGSLASQGQLQFDLWGENPTSYVE